MCCAIWREILLKEGKRYCDNAQKQMVDFVNFVHTSSVVHAIIINVKTPQYIIWFLLHPIVKIPSPKKAVTKVLSFLLYIFKEFQYERIFSL